MPGPPSRPMKIPSPVPNNTMLRVIGEMTAAQEQDQEVLWIRVTPSAVPGVIATLPLRPEQLRSLYPKMYAFPGGEQMIPDPKADHRVREIVVHPIDHSELLKDMSMYAAHLDVTTGQIRVCGLAIHRD